METADQSLKRRSLVLQSAAFSFVTATFISSVFVTILFASQNDGFRKPFDVVPTVLYMCYFAAILAGPFGFSAGALAGLLLTSHRTKLSSRLAVIVRAVAIGVVLSLLFPSYMRLITGWNAVAKDWRQYALSVAVGCVCAGLFGSVFWKRIVGLQIDSSDSAVL